MTIKFDDIDTSFLEDDLDLQQRQLIFKGVYPQTKHEIEAVFGQVFAHFLERYNLNQVLKGYSRVSVDSDGRLSFTDTHAGKLAQRRSWKEARKHFAQSLGISEKKLQQMIDAETSVTVEENG